MSPPGDEGERPVVRHRVVCLDEQGVHRHVPRDGHGLARDLPAREVERNREEIPGPGEDDVPRPDVARIVAALDQHVARLRLEVEQDHVREITADAGVHVREEHAASIGERASDGHRAPLRQDLRGPAVLGDARDRRPLASGEVDVSVLRPCRPDRGPRIRERREAAAVEPHLLDLARGEKADPVALGREERMDRALRPRDRCHVERGERAAVQARSRVGPGDVDQLRCVRGDRERRAVEADEWHPRTERQPRRLRQLHRGADRRRSRRGRARQREPGQHRPDRDAPRERGDDSRSTDGRRRALPCFAELQACVADIAQPLSRILGEAARHERPRRVAQAGELGLRAKHRSENVRDRLAVERLASRERLEEAAAKGPHVGALVHRLTTRLLRAHVGSRPEDDAELGSLRDRPGLLAHFFRARERLRDPEVQDLHLPVGRELHVGRLQVPVHDSLLVGGLEPVRDLREHGLRVLERHGATLESLRQGLALDQLHRERAVLEAVERGDVRMIQRREEPGLALEARCALGIPSELVGKDLERDPPAPAWDRGPDRPHPSPPAPSGPRISYAPNRSPVESVMTRRALPRARSFRRIRRPASKRARQTPWRRRRRGDG